MAQKVTHITVLILDKEDTRNGKSGVKIKTNHGHETKTNEDGYAYLAIEENSVEIYANGQTIRKDGFTSACPSLVRAIL